VVVNGEDQPGLCMCVFRPSKAEQEAAGSLSPRAVQTLLQQLHEAFCGGSTALVYRGMEALITGTNTRVM